MKHFTKNICPLMAIASIGNDRGPAVCLEDRCAWWDHLGRSCWIASGADCIREASNQIAALTITLEAQEPEEEENQ